jgi:hypothetical protein
MRLRSWMCVLVTLLSSSACTRDASRPATPTEPAAPAPLAALGLYDIAVTGIGGSGMRASIRAAPAAALAPTGAGLVFEEVSAASFTEGTPGVDGQRYVSLIYRVRNATGSALNNLTLLMVSRAGSIAGTPFSLLRRFDDSDADPTLASLVVPTGAVAMGSDETTMLGIYPDVIQAFQESEVAALTPPGDVTNVFPYGYVVRSARAGESPRTLPAATDPNQYDGLLTLAFRVPLQASPTDDVFSMLFHVLAVQDGETRLTESIEEGQDSAAVRRLRERAAAIGATTVTVLAGSPAEAPDVADYPGQRQICLVRTAGTASSPVTHITSPGAYSRLEMLPPGQSTSACGARFRAGTPAVPTAGVPYAITVQAMDRYGNVLTGTADTVGLYAVSGAAATFGAPTALVGGAAAAQATWTAAGSAVLGATGRRLRGKRAFTVVLPALVPLGAVTVDGGRPYVFLRGSGGGLWHNWWSGSAWNWGDLGTPAGIGIESAMGAVTVDGGRPYVFVRGSDGNLWLEWWSGSVWTWANLGIPGGVSIESSIGAGTVSGGYPHVFLRGSDGNLWVNRWSGSAWSWGNLGVPAGGVAITGSMGVTTVDGGRPYVFVRGSDGNLWLGWWSGTIWSWANLGTPAGAGIESAMGAITVSGSRPYVFVRGTDGNLWLRGWSGSAWFWANLGTPVGTGIDSAMGAATVNGGYPYVFVRGSDGNLWVTWWTGSVWSWMNLGTPGGAGIEGAMGTVVLDGARPYVFVRGSDGNLWLKGWSGSAWFWANNGPLSQ